MENNLNEDVGKRLKNRRKQLGITMADIQEKTNISTGNLSLIENGKHLPSALALIELSEILDCTIDWILKGDCFRTKAGNLIKEDEMYLLKNYRQLSTDAREEVIEFSELKLRREKRDIQIMETSSNLA